MNRATIIGNLTKDPDMRTTQDGKTVTNFTVAVNRRATRNNDHPEADFFRVAAWGALGESCHKYLAKGKKVAVVGSVQVRTYQDNNGETRANLEIPFAQDVEFLSPKDSAGQNASVQSEQTSDVSFGYTPVSNDDLPF